LRKAALSGAYPAIFSIMWKGHLLGVCTAGFGFVLLAGCGSSSSVGTPTSVHSPTPLASPASVGQLNGMVLRATDFPIGWEGKRYKADPSSAADQATVAKCMGVRNTEIDKVAEAHSQDFTLGTASISSRATSYRSQSDLDDDVAMLRSPKFSSCTTQLVRKVFATSLPAGTTIESVAVTITPGSAGGPANVVATGTCTGVIKVSANGQRVPFFISFAYIRGPLIEAEVDTSNIGAPVPASVTNSLVAMVASRASEG
jgi:hypothetical protein